MNKKQKLVPKMRFTEFENSNNWKQNKLGDMVNYVVDNRGKNPSYYCNDGIPIIDNFMIKNKAYPNLNEAVRYIDEYLYNNFIRKHNELNDVLITLVGNGIGNITLFPNEKSAIIQNTLGLRFNDNKKFMFYLMLAIHNEILLLNRGMAQPNIRQDELLDINIKLPDIKEQQKIGDFFTRLDEMIQVQQSKVNKVKYLKSAYLSEMFPKEGEKYPKRRFEGFIEPWEQVQVQDLFKITRGHVLSATKVAEYPTKKMKYPVYSSQTKNNGLMGYYHKYLYQNAITWTTDGANAGTVSYRPCKFYCTNVSGVLISNEGYANRMIAEALNQIAWKHVSKVGNPKLMNNIMAEITVTIPQSIKEQHKIAEFIRNLDNQISIEEEKLTKLEKLKQAYLNDMFV